MGSFGLGSFQKILYINISNYLLIFGSLLLWLGFFLMGVLAQRFEKVLMVPTRWQFMKLAPTGILVYVGFQIYSIIMKGKIKMGIVESYIAYTSLLVSVLLTLFGIVRFFIILKKGIG
ncbi:hypothetical protein DRN73_08775 [Candidatus Pacearchaeota archaeon]|nr:MAG: hypothetical protein DRN73_08775 [Candidatus Pacearchaeota archaeon]